MGVKSIAAAAALVMGWGALWAAPALTGGSEPEAEARTQPKAKGPDTSRRICRNLVRTGSRFTRRYCHTPTQWEESAEAARRLLQEGQTEGSSRDGEMNPH
jgi:hypothetical protein